MHIALKSSNPTHFFPLMLQNRLTVPLFEFHGLIAQFGTPLHQKESEDDLQDAYAIDPNAVRRNLPTACYNCHGFTFAARRGWLGNADIVMQAEATSYGELADNDQVLPGDVVTYLDGSTISHTGIIVEQKQNTYLNVKNGTIPLGMLSKWGFRGEYLHQIRLSPYGDVFKIYRYIRTYYQQ